MGNASPVVVAGGIKTALKNFIYENFIFVVSIILDIVIKIKCNKLKFYLAYINTIEKFLSC